MKIVVIRHSIRNRGGDRLVLAYCSYLSQKGHEVIYWTNEINTHFSIGPRIKIKKIPFAGIAGTLFFVLSGKFEADIILVDLVVLSVCAGVRNGKRVVCLAQDDDRTYYSSPVLRGMIGLCYRLSFSIMKTSVISVSEYLSQRLNQYAPGRIRTVPNGLDLKKFYPENRAHFLIERKGPVVIILYARSDHRKGLDIGIKAIEELNRIRGSADWELWTIGDDSHDINLQGIRVTNKGLLKDDNLRAVLSAADVYLSPSRHEGFGLMQLEAMACGCVMVTTQAFRLIEHGVSALVSPVNDWQSLAKNLNEVIDKPEMRKRLKENGVKLARNYSIDKSCSQFETTLLEFICEE